MMVIVYSVSCSLKSLATTNTANSIAFCNVKCGLPPLLFFDKNFLTVYYTTTTTIRTTTTTTTTDTVDCGK
jgi:hypothetical protein